MVKHYVAAILAAGFVAGFGILPALAGGIDGVWLRPKTGAHIKSFSCGGGLGLKIVKAKKKSSVGKTIMCGAKKTGANKYSGSLLSTEDGNTYSGTVTFSGGKLKLKGCALVVLCKNETWSRIR